MGWSKGFVLGLALGLTATVSLATDNTQNREQINELPVHIYNRYLIVAEGSIGNVHGLRLLVDTGTSTTAIDRRLAKRLGLPGQPAKLVNFDKIVPVEWGIIPEITLGPEQVLRVPVFIEDLSYLHAGPSPIDGIIGLDLLRRKTFMVDYEAGRVLFGATETAGMHSVPMRVSQIAISVEAQLNGHAVWMIADTGLLRTTLYERGVEAVLENDRVQGHVVAQSLGGPVENRVSTVLQLRCGGQELDREVLFVAMPASHRLSDVAGFLGPASFNPKQVVFDFESNQLLWKN